MAAGAATTARGTVVCTCTDGYRGARCDACAIRLRRRAATAVLAGDLRRRHLQRAERRRQLRRRVAARRLHLQPTASSARTAGSCAAGWHPSGGGACAADTSTALRAAAGGASGDVQAPTLRATLPASWDENWLASPAVVDLDGDGTDGDRRGAALRALRVGPRGSMLWRAAWGHSASDPGRPRQHADVGLAGDRRLRRRRGPRDRGGRGRRRRTAERGGLRPHGRAACRAGRRTSAARTRSARSPPATSTATARFEIVVNKTNTGPATAVFELDGTMRDGLARGGPRHLRPARPRGGLLGLRRLQPEHRPRRHGRRRLPRRRSRPTTRSASASSTATARPSPPTRASPTAWSPRSRPTTTSRSPQQGWGDGDRSEFTYSPPVIADIDGDGDLEVVLVGDHESQLEHDEPGRDLLGARTTT